MKKLVKPIQQIICITALVGLASCGGTRSDGTGWKINDKKNGGFQANLKFDGMETGPGLVFIEGGTFTMGRVEEDFIKDWNNIPRQVTVSSFYMDQHEVTNMMYREYLYWLDRVYDRSYYPDIYNSALPDSLVWRNKLGYNEHMVRYYLKYPAYNLYPVVGVSWLQASRYAAWRTDRANEEILIQEGIFNRFIDQADADNFNTEVYLYKEGEYAQQNKKGLKDLSPTSPYGKEGRPARIEDGILLPEYRLPTEAEWEFAAISGIGNRLYENTYEGKKFGWSGNNVRNGEGNTRGQILANYRRGRGNNMGSAGFLNDRGDYTIQVKHYPPNDYGLYDMQGNVAEWVMDVYRPLTPEDANSLNPFRGNVYKKFDENYQDIGSLEVLQDPQYKLDANGDTVKDANGDKILLRVPGQLPERNVNEEENLGRRNYQTADNIDYLDGDLESSIYYDKGGSPDGGPVMYDYAQTSMVNDHVRVYKGGSWRDGAYWLVPGTRRYLEEDQATDFIGFRCAMSHLGAQNRGEKNKKKHKAPKADKFKWYRK